ncbi:MAG: RimK family alpha-L-glutamate ligase [Planctomycetota bacterium]|nr:RimK family alpha-L-glutamate ligase [Planctomycetota bacterium]
MRIGILGNEGSWYGVDLGRAAAERGHDCVRLDFPLMAVSCGETSAANRIVSSGEYDLTTLDAVIVRTMPPGSLEQVVFRMDALARLTATGVTVVNSARSMECAVDKFLTTARLEAAGLTVPATVTCQDSEAAMEAFDRLGGDVVVKPLFGAEGRGICRVSDPDLAFRTFRTLERTGAVLYLQKFIRHPGFDVRVLVLDGELLGAMRRYSTDDFRTNVSRSAKTATHIPTSDETSMALLATETVGARIAGVDLLYDETGRCFVIEVNAVPGWRAFSRTNNVDVAGRLIDSLQADA